MKSFMGSMPGMNILLIGIGVLIGLFILICYCSLVVAMIAEEEAEKMQKLEEKKQKEAELKEMEKNDEQTETQLTE